MMANTLDDSACATLPRRRQIQNDHGCAIREASGRSDCTDHARPCGRALCVAGQHGRGSVVFRRFPSDEWSRYARSERLSPSRFGGNVLHGSHSCRPCRSSTNSDRSRSGCVAASTTAPKHHALMRRDPVEDRRGRSRCVADLHSKPVRVSSYRRGCMKLVVLLAPDVRVFVGPLVAPAPCRQWHAVATPTRLARSGYDFAIRALKRRHELRRRRRSPSDSQQPSDRAWSASRDST